jgi:hypothetical protein
MKALVLFLLGSLPALATAEYCQPIVIQHSKVPNTDQTNYVLTVNDTDPHLATVANGGYVQNSNGNDITFTSDSQGLNLLSWDPFEVYNPVTGQIVTQVQVGTVSHTVDTTIYRCAGIPSAGFQGGTMGVVWPSAYLGVYHLGNGTVLSAADSTSHANNGTIFGALATVGEIGGAAGIVGASDHIALPNSIAFPFTIEAWVNISSASGFNVITHLPGSYNDTFVYLGSGGYLQVYYGGGCASDSNVFVSASWQHVAATFVGPGSPCVLYVNGSQVAAGTMLNQSPGAITPAILGSAGSSGPVGSLDEVRIYNGAISASRIAADYNNQSNPMTFYIPGTWTAMQITRTGGSQSFVF